MKKLFFILGFLACFVIAKSQQSVEKTFDWNLVFENDQVKLFSKYTNCEIPEEGLYAEYILLKAENKTSETVHLSWYNDTYYPEGCSNCNHQRKDTKRIIILDPKQAIEGNCLPGLNSGLKVFSKWLKMSNPRILTQLTISEITTAPVN